MTRPWSRSLAGRGLLGALMLAALAGGGSALAAPPQDPDGASITGRVEDLEGKPVAGVRVQAFDPDVEARQVLPYSVECQSTESAKDGTFRLAGLAPKLWTVRVDGGREWASIVAPARAPAKDLVLRVGPPPRLRFRVKLRAGMTLRHVIARVIRFTGEDRLLFVGHEDKEATTETAVAFRDLPVDDDVILRFDVPGHPPYMQPLRLQPGEVRDMGVLEAPEPHSVDGVVHDVAGKPVAGVDVSVGWAGPRPFRTDTEGRFRFECVAAGPLEVRVRSSARDDAFSVERTVVVPAKEPVVVVLRRPPDVTGTVVDRADKPVAAEVSFYAVRLWGRRLHASTVSAGSDGKFAVTLQPGRYRVLVRPEDSNAAAPPIEAEIAEDQTTPLRLMIDPAAR